MVDVVGPTGRLADNVRCIVLLTHMIGIMKLGAEGAMPHVNALRRIIEAHAEIYARIYPTACKPKFNPLHHVVDNMEFLGAALKLLRHRAQTQSHAASSVARV